MKKVRVYVYVKASLYSYCKIFYIYLVPSQKFFHSPERKPTTEAYTIYEEVYWNYSLITWYMWKTLQSIAWRNWSVSAVWAWELWFLRKLLFKEWKRGDTRRGWVIFTFLSHLQSQSRLIRNVLLQYFPNKLKLHGNSWPVRLVQMKRLCTVMIGWFLSLSRSLFNQNQQRSHTNILWRRLLKF